MANDMYIKMQDERNEEQGHQAEEDSYRWRETNESMMDDDSGDRPVNFNWYL